ncbi:translation initiation factor eIF3 subunit [Hesseltinella vesiculosa]|uniref:Eukaryotic translation initiation factor 3 subunit J n=1 Tax=Hesseltinella vesiculosa TaxID=101127 RepID=A0A1X2GJK5_9FUNG|nr:translation initiation factor eIF3 subunit [Hesseltinella vesiculosa]
MSDWEEEEEVQVNVAPKANQWDDEDAEDDVKDNWEDSDEEEAPKEAPVIKKKVPLAQRIAEKKAAEAAKKKELEAKKAAMVGSQNKAERAENETEEERFERKQRERQMQLESDMANATDLFAGVAVTPAKTGDSVESMKPKTRVEFEAYRKKLTEMILANSKSMHYATFIDQFVRDIAGPLKDMDVRKAASTLNSLANDKQRQAKEATKSKKKGKPTLAAAGKQDTLDEYSYSNDKFDDFDDFM